MAPSPAAETSPPPAPAGREAIRFDFVTVEFTARNRHRVTALDRLNLAVAEHEFVALVGPSGCGKSTALRLVAGLIEPTAGAVRLAAAPPGARGFARVAVVFQSPTLLPWRTILDNVLYPVAIAAPDRLDACRLRAEELLEMTGLAAFRRSYPDELSGGMQQRAALCRALVLDPPVLLMDEPFSALDALTREDLQFELRRLHQKTGKTVLFVTHSISEAVLLADRVVVMAPRPGRLKQSFAIDLPAERTPATLRDARFLDLTAEVREAIYGRTEAA